MTDVAVTVAPAKHWWADEGLRPGLQTTFYCCTGWRASLAFLCLADGLGADQCVRRRLVRVEPDRSRPRRVSCLNWAWTVRWRTDWRGRN
jgi:hypothetical protein